MADVKKRTVVKKTKQFQLIKQERPGKKTWYEIKLNEWSVGANTHEDLTAVIKDISAMFESMGAKKQPADFTWFFWKYDVADALFTIASLKYTQ